MFVPVRNGLRACPRAVRQSGRLVNYETRPDILERAVVLGADLSVAKGSGLDELLDAIAVGRETRRRLHSSQMNGAA
jgi:hypothetical protein